MIGGQGYLGVSGFKEECLFKRWVEGKERSDVVARYEEEEVGQMLSCVESKHLPYRLDFR